MADGTKKNAADAEIDAALSAQDEIDAALADGADAPQTTGAKALGLGAADTASMGFADEAFGMGAWLNKLANGGGDMPRATGRGVDAPASDQSDYEAARDQYRGDEDTALKEHPALYRTGEAAGIAGTVMAPIPGAKGIEAAAKGVAPGVAEWLASRGVGDALSQGLGRVAGRAAVAAPIGAALGAVNAAGNSQASLTRDPGQLGKDVATGAAVGGVAGPIVGEGVHQLGAIPQRVRGLVSSITKKIGDRSDAELARQYGGTANAQVAKDFADPIGVLRPGESGPKTRGQTMRQDAALGADQNRGAARADAVADDVTKLADHADAIKWEEDIASKRPAVRNMIADEGVDTGKAVETANAAYNKARAAFDQLVDDVGSGPGSATLKRLKRETFDNFERGAERKANAAYDKFEQEGQSSGADYAADKFMQLDGLKRHVQRVIASNNPATAEIGDALRTEIETPLRQLLESPDSFGKSAAAFQQARNRGWTNALRLKQGQRGEFPFLSEIEGNASADPFRVKQGANRANIQRILDNAGDPAQRQQTQQLVEWADRESGLLDALTRHRGADDALKTRAADAKQIAARLRSAIAERSGEGKSAELFKAVAGAPAAESPNGVGAWLAHKIPYVGKAIEAADKMGPSVGKQATALQQAETVLRTSPSPRDADAANAMIDGMNGSARRMQGAGPELSPQKSSLGSLELPQTGVGDWLSKQVRSAVGAPRNEITPRLGGLAVSPSPMPPQTARDDTSRRDQTFAAHPSPDSAVVQLAMTDPSEIGEHGQELGEAAQKSDEHLAATMMRLAETDPKYQKMMRDQSLARDNER